MALCVLPMGPSLRTFLSFSACPLPPLLLQRTCVQGLNRKWCSSLPESTPGKHRLPSCAKVSVCMATAGLLRPDLLLMHVLGWRKFGSDGRVSLCDRFFPHSEVISRISGLSPAACLLGEVEYMTSESCECLLNWVRTAL